MRSTNTCVTMSINDDWDVEKHKTEHECDEHWELRRKFLLAHKKKFPEDELVCLAQVFSNVELLGCRYPKETMDLIAELSKEIVAEYREKQKNKLQRTFVKASEAASSKVKGCIAQTSTIKEDPISHKINKKLNTKIEKTTTLNNLKRPSTSVIESSPKKKRDLPYGDIILVERPGDVPQNTLYHSVGLSTKNLKWIYTNQSTKFSHSCDCTIYINSKQVACASGYNRKCARKEASAIALDELRKYYHTIKIKQSSDAQTNVNLTTIEKTQSQDNIPDDNIGKKLMKLMGWSGGGLGKSQQGIMEPVTLKQQLSREGLGLKSSSSNMHELKAKCRIAFKEFLMGDMQNDIVFSTDFTNDERAMIHHIARSMGLKSRSHGPSDRRRLVISRKVNIRSLVEELKSLGGTTEKYELIEPTNLDEELDSLDGTTDNYELIESSFDEDLMNLDETTDKYESMESTNLVEPNKRCIAQTSTITEKSVSDKSYEELFKIEETTTVNNNKTSSISVAESLSKNRRDLPYGDIILMEKPGDVPQNILIQSLGSKNVKWVYKKFQKSCDCTIYINSKQVAYASNSSRKCARKAASAIALDKLRKYYHTIKIKQSSDAQTNVNLITIEKMMSRDNIPDDNVGKKLLKLMGWNGGGLGKSQQGIVEPVKLKQQLNRKGLGLKSSSSNMHELKAKCRTAFQEFLMGNVQNDIVFSSELTNDESTMIHKVARSMGLRSRSRGPSNQRRLVISRKANNPSLVEELKNLGGSTEKYELIEPTNLDGEMESLDGIIDNYELIESTKLDEELKDLDGNTEKYESTELTSLIEELNKRCIAQTSTIIEKPISDKTNEKLKSKIEETTTMNNNKTPSIGVTEFLSEKKSDLPYGDILLVEKPGAVPQNILTHSVGSKNVKWIYKKFQKSCDCTIFINSKQVACASGFNRECARKAASVIALDELRKYYHTIKIKPDLGAHTNVNLTTIKETKSEDNILDDNSEKKLMKVMDLCNSALRKSLQDVMEPVIFKQLISRESLHLKSCSGKRKWRELKKKCRAVFEKFLMRDTELGDIVFSTDFTNPEKARIAQMARSMDLVAHSYNRCNQRILVISHKISIWRLVEELKNHDGTTKKFELIKPTSLDKEQESFDAIAEKDKLIKSNSLDKDLDQTIEKYESIKPTTLVEELRSLDETTKKYELEKSNEKKMEEN